MMPQIIDDRSRRNDSLVNNLFVPHKDLQVVPELRPATTAPTAVPADTLEGKIHSLKEGFGFITPSSGGANVFFFHAEVQNADFNDLKVGGKVRYKIGNNEKGPCAVTIEPSTWAANKTLQPPIRAPRVNAARESRLARLAAER